MANLRDLELELRDADATRERDKLLETFVYFKEYDDIVYPDRFAILIGRKGSGKSALLSYTEQIHDEIGSKCISIDPTHLLLPRTTAPEKDASIAELIAFYYETILISIGIHIGKSKKFTSYDDPTLNLAKESGHRSDDIIEKIAKYLTIIQFKTDWTPALKLPPRAKSTIEGIKRQIKTTSDLQILIDDLDTAGNFNTADGLNRIYAIIIASRKLTNDVPNLKILLSLRYDLWYRMQKNTTGTYELDKLRSHLLHFVPNDEQISEILHSWLKYVRAKSDPTLHGDPFKHFFTGDAMLPGKGEMRTWANFITTYSRQRPRDGMQLISMLAKHAKIGNLNAIGSTGIPTVLTEYSTERTNDINNEFSFACPKLLDAIGAFEGKEWVLSYDETDKKISKSISNGIALHGIPLKYSDMQSRISLWAFLYEIGFINPKTSSNEAMMGYKFIYHNENPNLVCSANLSHLKSLSWHVHPSYRDYLQSKSQNLKPFKPR